MSFAIHHIHKPMAYAPRAAPTRTTKRAFISTPEPSLALGAAFEELLGLALLVEDPLEVEATLEELETALPVLAVDVLDAEPLALDELLATEEEEVTATEEVWEPDWLRAVKVAVLSENEVVASEQWIDRREGRGMTSDIYTLTKK